MTKPDLSVVYKLCPHVEGGIVGRIHGTVAIVPPFGYYLVLNLNSDQSLECSSHDNYCWAVSQLVEPKGVPTS